jgi:maltooligosyltrehalose trehalohydrolase
MFGDRLSNLVSFKSLKLSAGVVLLSPYVPLLFMGEEYGEEAPFLYFVNHSDQKLIEAVRRGRKEEFKTFKWEGDIPDPQGNETFQKSKLQWHKRKTGKHKILLNFYTHLIQLRRETPALSTLDKKNLDICVLGRDRIVLMRRWKDNDHVFCCFNFNKKEKTFELYLPQGTWEKMVDSSDKRWRGQGTHVPDRIKGNTKVTLRGRSFIVYTRKLYK